MADARHRPGHSPYPGPPLVRSHALQRHPDGGRRARWHERSRCAPLCLGGNPFGWTADEATSFAVLDAYAEAGGNFIDTADRYTFHVPGNQRRRIRDDHRPLVEGPRQPGPYGDRDQSGRATRPDNLAPKTIRRAAEDSLRRLGTDHIDLYYAHVDDPATSLAETLDAFDALVRAGTCGTSRRRTSPRTGSRNRCKHRRGKGPRPTWRCRLNTTWCSGRATNGTWHPRWPAPGWPASLRRTGRGFLTGKYRLRPRGGKPRAGQARAHLNGNGPAVLEALDEVAAENRTTLAAGALAWLPPSPRRHPARRGPQSRPARRSAPLSLTLEVTADEVTLLDNASATPPADSPGKTSGPGSHALVARKAAASAWRRRSTTQRPLRGATGLVAPPRVRQRRS